MDFRQHDDTIIELRLTDRRGRPVRASVCHDLKIRVWTQDPRNYIAIYPRDIRGEGERDFLILPDWQLSPLSPGVIVYRYSFTEPLHDGAGHHHFHRMEGDFEKSETVVTGIYWKGMSRDHMPSNPVNSHSLEHLRDVIEEVERNLIRQIGDIRYYVEREYTNELSGEKARAREAERGLGKALNNAKKKIGGELALLAKSNNAFLGELGELKSKISSLEAAYKKDSEESSGKQETLKNEIQTLIDQAERRVRVILGRMGSQLKGTIRAIETVKSRMKVKDEELEGRIGNLRETAADLKKTLREIRRSMATRTELDEKVKSLEHSIEDARHYTDDAVEKLKDSYRRMKEYNESDIKEAIG